MTEAFREPLSAQSWEVRSGSAGAVRFGKCVLPKQKPRGAAAPRGCLNVYSANFPIKAGREVIPD